MYIYIYIYIIIYIYIYIYYTYIHIYIYIYIYRERDIDIYHLTYFGLVTHCSPLRLKYEHTRTVRTMTRGGHVDIAYTYTSPYLYTAARLRMHEDLAQLIVACLRASHITFHYMI